jgi:hypothetical protein
MSDGNTMPNTKTMTLKGPQGATGDPGATGPLVVSSDAGNQLTLGSDSKLFAPNQTPPIATTSVNGQVAALSGLSTDYLSGTNTCQDLATGISPMMQIARQMNINTLSNPNFEVDSRTLGAGAATLTQWACDRWLTWKGAPTLQATVKQTAGNVLVPGTNYFITSKFLRLTITTQQASLAAGDAMVMAYQTVEATNFRRVYRGSSIQALVRSSVAPLKFSVTLRVLQGSSTNYISLGLLGTIPTANTWTLVQWPNIPGFSNAWSTPFHWSPGYYGYEILVSLGSGATNATPSNNAWVQGNYLAASGIDNFFANPVNSTFDIAYLQHQGGADCSNLIEVPFSENLRNCMRYFQRSAGYNTAPAGGVWERVGQWAANTTTVRLSIMYPVELAKAPTISWYNTGGAANTIFVDSVSSSLAITAGSVAGNSRFMSGLTLAANPGVPTVGCPSCLGQWIVDTGW